MSKALNRQFSKKDMWMANKPMKRGPLSLVLRDIKIETTMRSTEMPIKKQKVK